jgi:hypothetical protein
MLAPRNKLWSTPREVVDEAIKLLEIGPDDIIYDIGCGRIVYIIRKSRSSNPLILYVYIL